MADRSNPCYYKSGQIYFKLGQFVQVDEDLLLIGAAITNQCTTKTLILENVINTLVIKRFHKLVSVILMSVPYNVHISFDC